MKLQNTLETTESNQHTPLYVVRNNFPLRFIKSEQTEGLRSRYFDKHDTQAYSNMVYLVIKAIPWVLLLGVIVLW